MRRVLAVLGVAVVVLTGACARTPTAPPTLPPTVSVSAGSASVAAGSSLVVGFGAVNSSIGDAWFVVGPPDAAVLVDRGPDYDSDCGQPGCGSTLTWKFDAVAAGTTTITFQYCYRTRPANCGPRPGEAVPAAVPLRVTVTA